ncbi:LAGLIDADG family homing endonuclease [Candidatus Gottesmanbacteria bacterium]|nr:LAGLIDADG family homing endonuclease [Candidatus Gottesmanbacteria bacterium]
MNLSIMSAYRIMSPWYITGFTEGEGCFAIIVTKHKTNTSRKDANLCFEIELRADDKPILELIQNRLRCGRIVELHYDRYGWKPHVKFVVKKQHDIFFNVIPFFKQYSLKGKKGKDFLLFCQAAEIFRKKEHMTEKGIEELLKLREFMNERRPMNG